MYVYKQGNTVNCQRVELTHSSRSNPNTNSLFSLTGLFRHQTCICKYCCLPDLKWMQSNLGGEEQLKEQEREKEKNRPREKGETKMNREKESKGERNQVKDRNSRMAPVSGGPPQWNTNCSDRLMSQCLFKWQLVRPPALRWAADLSGPSPH